jgi:hypothetical protein
MKGEKPILDDLFNDNIYKNLIEDIELIDAPLEFKKFLKYTASRFIKYNYRNISEFYAHQKKEVQEIMEKLALVIIDYNKAIEN